MMGKTLDADHLRSWIGREEAANDEITTNLVQRFNAMLDLPGSAPSTGDIAPLLIQYCLAQPAFATSDLGDDGHPNRGGFLPPVPLPRRMWAGSRLVFHGDLSVGDSITRVSRVADVTIKEGRSGTLCFVSVIHRTEVGGILKIEETQDVVYREAAIAQDRQSLKLAGEPAPPGAHTKPIEVSTALLFRYSALTFNGHRIHYDRPYATEVEFYPGLVLHGPLQATLLLNYAVELNGSPPSKFTFRGQSPLFDNDRISLHATPEQDRMRLWTSRENGPVAMVAEAVWP